MKTRKTAPDRKLSIYGFEAVNNGHNIYALLEFDITPLRSHLRKLRMEKKGCSLFVFMLKAIALCLKKYPLFNSMINNRKTSEFESVDISIPIEINKSGQLQNKQYLIRNAAEKSVTEIDREIETSKKTVDEQTGYIISKFTQRLLDIIPKTLAVTIIRMILRNHKKVFALSGSVFVTSVSMFSGIPGYIIPYIGGPKASSFAIGSTGKKALVVGNEIQIREIINITVAFNHDIIDGAPAARFLNELRKIVEKDYELVR